MFARLSLVLLVAACSSSDSTPDPGTPVDAPVATVDANPNAVQPVTCPGNVALTVTTNPMDYVFSAPPTIAVGGVVHFRLASIHNMTPTKDLPSDPGLAIGFGGDVCLKFTKAGTFNFFCSVHTFHGAITVQ